jgi:PAS domain S-box-containing protein
MKSPLTGKAKPKKASKTSSRRTNSATARSERRFQTLIKQSNDGIQLVTPDGKILYSSDSVEKIVGYKPQDVQGGNIRPYIHDDDWDSFGPVWEKLLAEDGATVTLEYRVKHQNGTWIWLETVLTNHLKTPNIKAILGNFRNITERKLSEEKLRKSEEQLRFMAESLPQKIFTSDPDGITEYINPQWSEYSGSPSLHIMDRSKGSLIHEDDLEFSMDRWRYSLESGEPFSIEHRMRRHDGMYRWHITRAKPMRDDKGKIVRWFGSSTDIHDSKISLQREHELTIQAVTLSKQREKLLALNASKDEFISLASHQLRTPATVVKQYLHLILDGYAGDINPSAMEMIAKANASNERQIEIVDDLLRVARLDAGKIVLDKNMVNIVPLVQEVANELHAIYDERNQQLTITYSEPGISTSLDQPRIKMVLENLLDNASKYSPHGKTVRVAIKKDNGDVTIAIKDQGVGIKQKDIPKLFQKFSRLANPLSVSVGGTGLGLYWAKRVVELHNGTIEVESSYGEGSEFSVILPS